VIPTVAVTGTAPLTGVVAALLSDVGPASVEQLLATSANSPLPPLLVAVPLLVSIATLAVGYRFDRAAWSIAAIGAVLQVAIAGTLAWRVVTAGRVIHVLGGFVPPFGIVLVVDGLSALVALLIAVVTVGVLIYLRQAGPRGSAFYAEFMLLVAGLSGLGTTGDVFNMYVFLEITGLAAYALVASGDSGLAAVAALKYLMLGTVGASLFLLGVGYALITTGTLTMADLAVRLAEVGYRTTPVRAAFAFMTVGLGVKIALFPLHTWQPDAYSASPDGVSAFISALVSTVSAYALVRVVYSVFTVEFFAANPLARDLLLYGAALSVIAGSTLAVTQREVKRTLAYSSVSQFGLVVVGFALANRAGLVGGIIHLLGHAVMKGSLFLAVGIIAIRTDARTIEEYAGLAGRVPVASAAFAVLAFAMIGVPPAVGFVGKWYILLGAVEAGEPVVALVVVASTLLTLAYFARLIERMYFSPATDSTGPAGTVADGGESSADRDGRESESAVADGGSAGTDAATVDRNAEDTRDTRNDSDVEADTSAGAGTDGDAGSAELDPVTDDPSGREVTAGMTAVVVLAAIVAVALGLLATELEALLRPTLEVLLS
jgi:multicomponent Na+:H+ antiporter subunit D